MTVVRAALVAMICVGIGSVLHDQGTYALFAAQATNPANTFQVGTLKMSNTRAGTALFSTTAANAGAVNSSTQATTAGGSQVFAPLNPSMSSYVSPTLPGATPPILPNNPGFSVNGNGGIAPGMMLVNSVTVGNVGTLSAGRIRLTVPSITLENNPSANCDLSNALIVNGGDVCGRGRLTDVLRVTAFYLAGHGRAVCVLGAPELQGRVVAATNDGEAIAACAGPSLGASLVAVANTASGNFALAQNSNPFITIDASVASGDRISPALASGIIVKNYRNGTIVDDWEAGLQRPITFAVAFDPGADNRYQGARAAVDIKWDSTSLVGAPAGGVDMGVVLGSGTVSGTLYAPTGSSGLTVNLVPMNANGQGYGTQAGEAGTFTFANVPPGNYAVASIVEDVPLYRTISVNAGTTTTVALVATPVDTRVVTLAPAGAATGKWTVEVGMSTSDADANGVSPTVVGIGFQYQTVSGDTLPVKYRPADVATTSVTIRKGTPSQPATPQLWYGTSMSALLANGTVTIPLLSIAKWACSGQTCTAAIGVTPASDGWFSASLTRNGFNTITSSGPINNNGPGTATFSTKATGTFTLDVTANLSQDGSNWSPFTVTQQVTIPAVQP
ncbi:MAG: carboxypeptidase regulatory-like domain-containing protein [Chloroflexi bacterium]|nr:carboxypeptidase regulatory-like domain-containing protein [Chloroflexota bacterium]